MLTPYGILSFPHLFTPKPRAEGGDPVYSCSILFDEEAQKKPEFLALKKAVDECVHAKWAGKVKISQFRYPPFRDAGEKSDKYQGYRDGVLVLNAWSKDRPGIVNRLRQDILLPEEVWAGQQVRLDVNPYAWEKSGNRGVSFGLNNIQVVRADMPRIDGKMSAAQVFGEIPEEELADCPF